MKENTNLVTKTPEELSPVQEKELLSLIKAEASSFVPDKLCEILEACGIESGVSEEDEAFVLGLMKCNVFVPNDKEALDKATGAFVPKADELEDSLTRRMRREAKAFVPDKKREIYSETGLKEHFSFSRFVKKGWPFLSGAALAIAGIAVGTRVYVRDQEDIKSATSYINVAITPSTCEAPALAKDAEPKTNNYKPSWGITADNNNLVKQVSANNYSANLVAVKSDTLLEKSASRAVADLINPCFEKGYLEAVDKTSPNTITIDVVSTIDNYSDIYEGHFKDALESALQKDRVYANVQFNVHHIGRLVKTDTIKAGKISKIYTTFNRAIEVERIAKSDSNILDNLDTAINATALARLSEAGLGQLKEGLKETYLSYLGIKPIASSISSEHEFNARKAELAMNAWCLKQYFGTGDGDKLSTALSREDGAIYVSDLNVFMIDETPKFKDNYREVRNYILAKATSNKENYIRFLEDLTKHAKLAQKSTGYFPDASKADPGVWSHGEGWCEEDWGPGGWAPGGWGPGEWHF